VSSPQDYLQRLADLEAAVARAQPDGAVLVERAAGLIAGRVGCRIDEAHAQLRQLAAEQGRDKAALAADVLRILQSRLPAEPAEVRAAVDDALRVARPPRPAPAPARPSAQGDDSTWVATMRQVVAAVAGNHTVVSPVRGADGEVTDFTVVAVSPTVEDLSGRRERHLLGRPVSAAYPGIVGGPVWHAWIQTLADGVPREVGPIDYEGNAHGRKLPVSLVVRVHAVGPGLFNSWVRPDEESRLSDRIAQTERLGNLGWGEWDLLSGNVVWSEELYRIYERDPAEGPLRDEESRALQLAEDAPIHAEAAAAFGRGETVDTTYRACIGGRIKHLRTVVDAVRDRQGRPIKVYGIVQDVTGPETNRARLAEIERQLRDQQTSLAAEHRLAAQLQQIILPIPVTPIDLPGLQVAVRYLPAEQASRVGGDWYHTSVTDDGDVLLAVGDVAGHGIKAATTMALLRYALAALSITSTTDPQALLSHLNRLLRGETGPVDTASAVIARYRPATRTLVWAQAGHPPPMRTRDGATSALERPRGPLLGALRAPEYDARTTELRDGDLLLLYTDGLVENRHRTALQGFAPVARTLDEVGRQPLIEVVERLQRANPEDDTCILAVRVSPHQPESR
jgi:serine phosphatase RsbU (regulator of sigma subunit)